MSTAVLSGTVTHCAVTLGDSTSARPNVYLRVIARQPDGGQEWEALQYLGRGYEACARGDDHRARLRPGTRVEAHGCAVNVRTHGGRPALVLCGVHYIRGGDAPARHRPSRQVQELLQRLAARRPQPKPQHTTW